jgi:hypothetical protein
VETAAMPILLNYETTPIRHQCVPDQSCNLLKRFADATIDLFSVRRPDPKHSNELVPRWCRRPGQGCYKIKRFDALGTHEPSEDGTPNELQLSPELKDGSDPRSGANVEANMPETESEVDAESRKFRNRNFHCQRNYRKRPNS